jgi:hypothetical protein
MAETISTPSGKWLRCVRYDGDRNFGALNLNKLTCFGYYKYFAALLR